MGNWSVEEWYNDNQRQRDNGLPDWIEYNENGNKRLERCGDETICF